MLGYPLAQGEAVVSVCHLIVSSACVTSLEGKEEKTNLNLNGNNDRKKSPGNRGVATGSRLLIWPIAPSYQSSSFVLGNRKRYRRACRWTDGYMETSSCGSTPPAFSLLPSRLVRLTRWNRTGLQTTRAPVRGLALWLILCSFNKLPALGRVLVQSIAAFVSSACLSLMFGPRSAATWRIIVRKWRQRTGSQAGPFH